MRKICKCLSTRSDITQLTALEHNLVAYATKLDGIKLFSYKNCTIKLNLVSEYLNEKTTAICFSKNTEILAFANSTIIYIVHMPTKRLLKRIDTENEKIEIISFDPSSNYIIAGSSNGRVLQYRYNGSLLLSRLCSFPYDKPINYSKIKTNYVSAFAFYDTQLACSGYGGAIFVTDLLSEADINVITHTKSKIDALCFLNNNTLISGNIDGDIDIISLTNIHSYKRLNSPFRKIQQILIMPNPNYIMVTSQKNIAIFDIKNFKLIDANYIELGADIDKVTIINKETLIIAFDKTQIIKIELPNVEKLNSLILHNSLDKAYELIEKEPMLKDSKQHQELEKKYQEIYLKAVDALIHHNKELALQLTEMFKHTKQKKDEIKNLFIAFENYPKFQSHFSEQKLILAYAMATKYPALQYTWQYKRMEKAWKEAFKNAQRQILLNKEENAKLCLSQYMTILSKRQSIQLILKQNKEFLQFLKAIEKKDYKTLNKLALKNKLFTQIPTYKTLIKEAQEYLQKAKSYIKKAKIAKAKKYLSKIENMAELKEEVLQLYANSKDIQILQNAYENNNFKSCYELLDIHKHLNSTELGQLLQKHWSKLMHKCEEYALEGDIKKIQTTLGELITLSTRRGKIGDILRLGFRAKIQILIKDNKKQEAENIIYSYIDIFAKDKEISSIMKQYETNFSTKLAITYDEQTKPTRDSWIYSKIVTQ